MLLDAVCKLYASTRRVYDRLRGDDSTRDAYRHCNLEGKHTLSVSSTRLVLKPQPLLRRVVWRNTRTVNHEANLCVYLYIYIYIYMCARSLMLRGRQGHRPKASNTDCVIMNNNFIIRHSKQKESLCLQLLYK